MGGCRDDTLLGNLRTYLPSSMADVTTAARNTWGHVFGTTTDACGYAEGYIFQAMFVSGSFISGVSPMLLQLRLPRSGVVWKSTQRLAFGGKRYIYIRCRLPLVSPGHFPLTSICWCLFCTQLSVHCVGHLGRFPSVSNALPTWFAQDCIQS